MKNERINELYNDYLEYLKLGKSHDEAMMEFQYLHPITLSRLDNHINKKQEPGSSINLGTPKELVE